MGFTAVGAAIVQAQIVYRTMTPAQRAAWDQARADEEAMKDRARAKAMWAAVAKGSKCPWRRMKGKTNG